MSPRLPALDWMRGLAVVLMLTDHASEAFNPNRPVADSVYFLGPGAQLDGLEFAVRWLSHLCAPAFLFLAGTSLALSVARKRAQGASEGRIDRELLVRGLLILAVDLTFINLVWEPGMFLLQVMFAIGLSMLLMIPLRRLPARALTLLALLVLAGHEALMPPGLLQPDTALAWLRGLFVTPALFGLDPSTGAPLDGRMPLISAYPVLPWWAMLALGWALGRWLLGLQQHSDGASRAARGIALGGLAGLGLYAVLHLAGGYGDARLPTLGQGWAAWLHVSKYPPSLAFAGLELGLMGVLLAGFFALAAGRSERVAPRGPLLVFGQTAFFFYAAHIALLEAACRLLGMQQGADMTQAQLGSHLGLQRALVASAAALVVLYPLCLGYRRLKRAHPTSPLRYF